MARLNQEMQNLRNQKTQYEYQFAIEKAQKELSGVERTLSNEGFVAKAAPAVIEKKRAQAAELTATIDQLKSQIADFQ